MITVCPGWTAPRHAEIVLRDDGDPTTSDRTSHGMCPTCEHALHMTMDAQYAAHRELHERSAAFEKGLTDAKI